MLGSVSQLAALNAAVLRTGTRPEETAPDSLPTGNAPSPSVLCSFPSHLPSEAACHQPGPGTYTDMPSKVQTCGLGSSGEVNHSLDVTNRIIHLKKQKLVKLPQSQGKIPSLSDGDKCNRREM